MVPRPANRNELNTYPIGKSLIKRMFRISYIAPVAQWLEHLTCIRPVFAGKDIKRSRVQMKWQIEIASCDSTSR